MSKVAVFGMGSFGTALANVLAQNGHEVLMWGKNKQSIEEINTYHTNSRYLNEAKLEETIKATFDLEEAVNFSD
ncbi:MAG: 3-hydroxyacyl-CoA dehydrogenase NAD-binding domain-containing protein, partial [Staphylococcus simulans]|nr:3-hydroxyacyl-CoA dehydrogenase NAD-binding domain-containing protein [Staphylococcus simulans]